VLISERASAKILTSVGLSREQARLLLRTGVAGAGERAGTSRLYEESRVRDVAARPLVDELLLREACPVGVFVARLARGRSLDTSATWRRGHWMATRGGRLERRRPGASRALVPGRRGAVVRVRSRSALVLLGPFAAVTMTP
jgi:hypothetical protein